MNLSTREFDALNKVIGNSLSNKQELEEAENPPSLQESNRFAASSPTGAPSTGVYKAQFTQQPPATSSDAPHTQEMQEHFNSVKIELEAILGRTKMPLGQLYNLRPGSVIALQEPAGTLVDIEANGKLIARGEVVVVDDNYGVHILEIVQER